DPHAITGGKEGGQEGISKVRVIDDVEEISAELHFQPLPDWCVLVEGKIPLLERGAEKGIAVFSAVVKASRASVECARPGTRHLEGGKVNDGVGKAGSRIGIADH